MNEHIDFGTLIQELHHKRDWRVRQQAVRKLAELGTDQALQSVVSALYDESPHVVQAAAGNLWAFGDRAIPGLLEALYAPQEIAERHCIIHVLDAIGDATLIPHFVHFLHHDDPDLHYAAAFALTKICDESALPHLIKALNRPAAYVAGIARALAKLRSPQAVPALKPHLLDDDQVARRYTSIALGRIGTEEALDALLEASRHSRAEVRANAAEGLGIHNDDRAYQRLVEMLQEDIPDTRSAVVYAIGKTRRSEAVPLLISQLDTTDADAKRALHYVLADSGDLQVVSHLIRYYREDVHSNGQTLFNFARKYFNYDSMETVQAVNDAILALDGLDQNLRLVAVWLLHAFNDDLYKLLEAWDKAGQPREQFIEPELHTKVMQLFVALLEDDNPDIRLSVMEPLQRTGDMRALAGVIKNLDHADKSVVSKAALLLWRFKNDWAVPELVKAVSSTNSFVRDNAMGVLAAIEGEAAYQAFVAMLDHADEELRYRATIHLARLGNDRAISRLREQLAGEINKATRINILSLLGDLGDKQALSEIIRIFDDDWDKEQAHPETFDAFTVILMTRDEIVLPALYKVVNSDLRWGFLRQAVDTIAAIGSPREIADRMFGLLEHKNDTVRTSAATRLGYLGAGTDDLDLRDHIVSNLIQHLQDDGPGYHAAPHVAHAAAKSLYFVGTTEAIDALKNWEFKQDHSGTKDK